MKRLFLPIILAVFFIIVGCSAPQARQNVMSKYPGCAVAAIPGSSIEYIVRKPDGSVWYCYSNGVNSDIANVQNDVEIIPAFDAPSTKSHP